MPTEDDTTATIEPVQDTAPVDTASADTSTSAPSDASASSSVDGTAPVRETLPADGSLRTDTSANQTPQQRQVPDPSNWEPRYKALQSEFTKRSQELARVRQDFNGVNPNDIRAFREQQAKAHAAGLPMWNREHPQHGQFGALKARWAQTQSNYQTAIGLAPPEQHEAIRQQFLAGFTQQERDTLAAHGRHKQDFGENFAEDPEGTIGSIVERRVNAIIEQREQQTQLKGRAENTVGAWFQSQEGKEVLDAQRPFIEAALAKGIPWMDVRLQAENNWLRSKLSRSNLTVQSADERNRLTRTRANITRDPNTAQVLSYDQLVAKAASQGIQEGGPKWMEFCAAHGQ